MNYSLLIEGKKIELDNSFKFGITLQNFDFDNQKGLKNFYSSKIKISKADIFFEFLNFPNFNNKSIKVYSAILLGNGLELLDGKFVIEKVTKNEMYGVFYEEKKNILDLFNGFNLKDISYSLLSNKLSVTNDIINVNGTSDDFYLGYSNDTPLYRYDLFLLISEKYIFEKIISDRGLSVNYNGINLFEKDRAVSITEYEKFKAEEKTTSISEKKYKRTNILNGDVPLANNNIDFRISFSNPKPSQYTYNINYEIHIGTTLVDSGTGVSDSFSKNIKLENSYIGGAVRLNFTLVGSSIPNTNEVVATISDITIVSSADSIDIIIPNNALPSISQKDFFLDVLARNFCNFYINNDVIEIVSMSKIIDKGFGVVNWTKKLVDVYNINYKHNKKENQGIQYANSEGVSDNIKILNNLNNGYEDLYKSIFDYSDVPELTEYSGDIANTLKNKTGGKYIFSLENAEFFDIKEFFRNTYVSNKKVRKVKSIDMNLIKSKYQKYISLFNNYKKISVNLNLSYLDIKNIDLKKLVLIDDVGVCVIDKVNKWQQGKVTKVDLIKIE